MCLYILAVVAWKLRRNAVHRDFARRRVEAELDNQGLTALNVYPDVGGYRFHFVAVDHDRGHDVRGSACAANPEQLRFESILE